MIEKDNSVKDQYLNYAIHFSLLIIERGYPQLIEEELFGKFISRIKEPEYNIYFGVVICFLYYIVMDASDEEIQHFSFGKNDRNNIRNILEKNSKAILKCINYCSVSYEYCNELKKYLRPYEFLIPYKRGKVMVMDSVVDRCMAFFLVMSSPWNIGYCLKELVGDDWYRIYMTIVNNDFSIAQFNILSEIMSSPVQYEKLEDAVRDISLSVVIEGKDRITDEDEVGFKERISGVLREFSKKISLGEVGDCETNEFTISYIVRHLALTDSAYDMEITSCIKEEILFRLARMLMDKLERNDIYDHDGAEEYLEQSNSFDFRFGNIKIPLYDKDRVLRKNIQDRIPDEFNASLKLNGVPEIIDVNSKKLGIHIGADVTVRNLTDDEKLQRCNCTGEKYKEQIVNDVYFEFGKEEYFKYVDNEYRMLEIKCLIKVSTGPDSGTYTLFNEL